MSQTLPPLQNEDHRRIANHVLQAYAPPPSLIEKVTAAGSRLVPPPTSAFTDYGPAANACRHVTGDRPYCISRLEEQSGPGVMYVRSGYEPRVSWSDSEISRMLREMSTEHAVVEDGVLYIAVPNPEERGTFYSAGLDFRFPAEMSTFANFKKCAGGSILKFLKPQAETLGILLEPTSIKYRKAMEFGGVTINREIDVTSSNWVYSFLFGTASPYLGYAGYNVTHLLSFICTSALVTPEFMGIDAERQVYLGSQERLEDPLFQGVVRLLLNVNREGHTFRAFKNRKDADLPKLLLDSLKDTDPSVATPRTLDSLLSVAVAEQAAGKKLIEALGGKPGSPVPGGLPGGQRLLEVLGSSQKTLAQKAAAVPVKA